MGIIVKRPVRVKVIVTEGFKIRRAAEIRAAVSKLDAIAKRIDSQMEKTAPASEHGPEAAALSERLRIQKRRNLRARAALARELEAVSSFDLGAEYDRGILEGTVEVELGDDFSKLGACEIVIKDDKIVEIRDRLCPEQTEISS